MVADKQASRKDDRKETGRDDLKEDRGSGRYEGGRDSDQNRQAKQGQDQTKGGKATSGMAAGKDRRGSEEE